MPKTLYLIRHAEPEKAFTKRFLGRLNPSLSPDGIAQAESLAERFAPLRPQRIIASPLNRAWMTAGILAKACGLEAEKNDKLLEIDFGKLEGLTFKEASEQYPGTTDSWQALSGNFCFPGGEDFAHFNQRAAAMAEFARNAEEESLAFVAHGGVLRGILCNLLAVEADGPLRFRLAYAALTTIELYEGGGAVMTGFNVWRSMDSIHPAV